jgi:hypothetical protein
MSLSDCCLQGLESDALAAILQAATHLTCLTLPTLASGVASSKDDFMRVIRLVQLWAYNRRL